MSDPGSEAAPTAAARLLARERLLAALAGGQDALIEDMLPPEQAALLAGALHYAPERIGLAVVPNLKHPLCALAQDAPSMPTIQVAPDMSEAARRDLGIALRNKAVQLLIVTPERLSQPKFVQFIRSQEPAFVAILAIQRLWADAADYFPPYESLRALRGLFPGVPVLAIADNLQPAGARDAICSALCLHPGNSAPPAMPAGATPAPLPVPAPEPEPRPAAPEAQPLATRAAPPGKHKPAAIREASRSAFPLFDREASMPDVARELGRDARWVCEALADYIRHTGRTHPFPWVDKPTYLKVSMAAGQAESTEPRLLLSVLGNSVGQGELLVVIAALENRRSPGGRNG